MTNADSVDVAGNVVIVGICENCAQAAFCLYREKATHPIWFCEQFENVFSEPSPQNNTAAHPAVKSQTRLLGLCANCEKRETCRLPKPESGIWHCEEYV